MASTEKHDENSTGSSESDEPVFLVIGQFGRPHGVRGEIQFRPQTDFPERLLPGKVILVGDAREPHTIRGVRGSDARMIIALDGVSDRDQAGFFRNELVFVSSAEIPALEDGEFYHHELLGLQLVTEDGEVLGVLHEIIVTPANEVFVVHRADGSELLLPAIDDVILGIDLETETILVHLLAGL